MHAEPWPPNDTTPAAQRFLTERLRAMPGWRKLALVGAMNRTLDHLALSGLRQRHPQATSAELRRRLADIKLGPELAIRATAGSRNRSIRVDSEPVAAMVLIVEALEALGVPYLIGGSMASAFYGAYRATADVDIVADLHPAHIAPLVARLTPNFYIEGEDLMEAITQRRSFNAIHLDTMFKVDIFVARDRPFEQAQFARRTSQVITADPERTAFVASAEDTVLAKLEWFQRGGGVSDRQWGDILGVLRARGADLDLTYLREWAVALGVTTLLERALAEAGSE